ncbi:MAG: dTDP-4-dehydrorhamnose 3,5-epimerase family protein [Caldilineaceae bacterium]
MKFAKLAALADDRHGRFPETFRREGSRNGRGQGADQPQLTPSGRAAWPALSFLAGGLLVLRPRTDPRGPGRLAPVVAHVQNNVETIVIGEDNQMGVFIPVGVAHGFVALTDATLTYLVDNYYTGGDELGVAWNDPTLAIDWGVENPILSGRDQANPRIEEIPAEKMPK